MKLRNDTSYVIVHHSATDRDATTFEAIKRYHMDVRGYDNVGYHRVITGDGVIHNGMPENMVGYHCKHDGYNYDSVGVCLTGNFDEQDPSDAQLSSLREVIERWRGKYDIPLERTLTHLGTGAATACPGRNLNAWVEAYRSGGGNSMVLTFKQFLDNDISTEVEEEFNLKGYDWYNKRWTGREFLKWLFDTALLKDEYLERWSQSTVEIAEKAQQIISYKGQIASTQKSLGDAREALRISNDQLTSCRKEVDTLYENQHTQEANAEDLRSACVRSFIDWLKRRLRLGT